MTENGDQRKGRRPEAGEGTARRARQAEALRRNLARRKAQSRDRSEPGGGGAATDKDPPKR